MKLKTKNYSKRENSQDQEAGFPGPLSLQGLQGEICLHQHQEPVQDSQRWKGGSQVRYFFCLHEYLVCASLGWMAKKKTTWVVLHTLWYFLRIVKPVPRSASGLYTGCLMTKIRKNYIWEKNLNLQNVTVNDLYEEIHCFRRCLQSSRDNIDLLGCMVIFTFAIFLGKFGLHSLKNIALILFLGSCCEQRVSLQLSGR